MCDEALIRFHNSSDPETLFVLSYIADAILRRTLPTGALEVALMVATSFSSCYELDWTCPVFYRPFSVSVLVHCSNRDRQDCSNHRLASEGSSALATGSTNTQSLPVVVGLVLTRTFSASRGRPRELCLYVSCGRRMQ
jgi:hypothetical protein